MRWKPRRRIQVWKCWVWHKPQVPVCMSEYSFVPSLNLHVFVWNDVIRGRTGESQSLRFKTHYFHSHFMLNINKLRHIYSNKISLESKNCRVKFMALIFIFPVTYFSVYVNEMINPMHIAILNKYIFIPFYSYFFPKL